MRQVTKHINKSVLQEVTIRLNKDMKNKHCKGFKGEASRVKNAMKRNWIYVKSTEYLCYAPGAVLVSAMPASSKENLRFFWKKACCEIAATSLLEGAELILSVG